MRPRVSPRLDRYAATLFPDESERRAFCRALTEGVTREQAIVVLDSRPEIGAFPRRPALDWQPEFVVRLADDFRPGRHPLHEKGAYYVLDLSSVFAATPLVHLPRLPDRILDVCAAPGGKSVFAWRALLSQRSDLSRSPDDDGNVALLANETIRKRTGTLIANFERCRIAGSAVGSADPSVWSRRCPAAFDLVMVDAPCSGQSLLAKGEEAPGCFQPAMIDMNVGRQRRIVGHSARCLRPGGFLLYMTCTFSKKENEGVVEWLLRQYPNLECVATPALAAFQSPYAEFPCYRLFPQSGLGAGAFSALLRLPEDSEPIVGPSETDSEPVGFQSDSESGEAPAGSRFAIRPDRLDRSRWEPRPNDPVPADARFDPPVFWRYGAERADRTPTDAGARPVAAPSAGSAAPAAAGSARGRSAGKGRRTASRPKRAGRRGRGGSGRGRR
ncbi:MAG: RsmB/NOP family class I SAM-dependent RNA methyltransferase [Fimbriimonadaceae bacterium]